MERSSSAVTSVTVPAPPVERRVTLSGLDDLPVRADGAVDRVQEDTVASGEEAEVVEAVRLRVEGEERAGLAGREAPVDEFRLRLGAGLHLGRGLRAAQEGGEIFRGGFGVVAKHDQALAVAGPDHLGRRSGADRIGREHEHGVGLAGGEIAAEVARSVDWTEQEGGEDRDGHGFHDTRPSGDVEEGDEKGREDRRRMEGPA